nr:hypothetical protein [uncultured bacterium]
MKDLADRLSLLGKNKNLEAKDVAERIGINENWYRDVESYHDEFTTNISIKQAVELTKILETSVLALLSENNKNSKANNINPKEIIEGIKQFQEKSKISLEELENKIGWEIEPIYNDPNLIWERPIVFLQDTASVVGTNWEHYIK